MNLLSFTDILTDESCESQPISLSPATELQLKQCDISDRPTGSSTRPAKHMGQRGDFRSVEEIDEKYRCIFTYPFFNLVQSKIIEDALYSDKSMVVCAPTGSGKTVVFEMAILELLMKLEDNNHKDDFKIIYMAPVKALCTERLTEWYPKFTKLGLHCIEVTGDTDVDFSQLKSYSIIITTPEKWDMLTRRWKDYRELVRVIKLFLIDEVHILNDENRGPVLEAVVSRMKTIELSSQSAYRIEKLQKQLREEQSSNNSPPRIRFVAVSATVANPEDVASWLGSDEDPAIYHKYGDECRPVKLRRVVEGYPCSEGTSIFKFDIILNYKLWPIIQKYYDKKPTLIFCNTRKSVAITAEALSREVTMHFNAEQKDKLMALASTIKNKKLQALVLNGVGCHHAGLLFEERVNIEQAFRQRELPILVTTTTLAMGVNLPAHLVIVKNTQQYVNGAYQEYSISTVLQMVGRAGRPQFDTEATAVIMTRLQDKPRYQALVGGSEPLQSYLHKRLTENLNSEAALQTVTDVAQCVQWLRSTFLYVRAAKDPKRYLGLPPAAAPHLISKKIEELCVKAMNGLARSGLITMDEASCIESTEAGRLMSIFYLDFETMKQIMKIEGTETLEQLLWIVCESHELSDMHLRVDERRCLNALNRSSGATIRYPMKGKITTRQMKLSCVIQAILGCLPIPDPSLNQESTKIMRIAERVCKCMVAYVTRPEQVSQQPQNFSAILNAIILAKCIFAHLWENSPYVSKQLKGIGPTFSTLLATAGKTNFMLLDESHPRDLERIMKKGPPAGNVLRKQISLLPKYQLTITPVDEESVKVELLLLNRSYLSENIGLLTAGENHSSYIVVGDSENHILLLATFKDKDLISVYDGTVTYTITRKHRFEHEIFVHCLSSRYVGIDAQCDYLFKDMNPSFPPANRNVTASIEETPRKRNTKRQTNITDTFKERKRKANDVEIFQSKEKKKRQNNSIEKIKELKESFGVAPRLLQEDINKLSNISIKQKSGISNNINEYIREFEDDNDFERDLLQDCRSDSSIKNLKNDYQICEGQIQRDSLVDDGHIDSILNEIENEMSKNTDHADCTPEVIRVDHNKSNSEETFAGNINTTENPLNKLSCKIGRDFFNEDAGVKNIQPQIPKKPEIAYNSVRAFKNIKHRYNKTSNKFDNYSFIDLLEKNVDLSDDEPIYEKEDESGWPESIRCQVQHYLNEAQKKAPTTNNIVEKELLESPEKGKLCNAEGNQNLDILDENTDSKMSEDLPSNVITEGNADDLEPHEENVIFAKMVRSNKNYIGRDKRDNEFAIFDVSDDNKQQIVVNSDHNDASLKVYHKENDTRGKTEDKIEGSEKEEERQNNIQEGQKLFHCLSGNLDYSETLNRKSNENILNIHNMNTYIEPTTKEPNFTELTNYYKNATSLGNKYSTYNECLRVSDNLNDFDLKEFTKSMCLYDQDIVNNQLSMNTIKARSYASLIPMGHKIIPNNDKSIIGIKHNNQPSRVSNEFDDLKNGCHKSCKSLVPFDYNNTISVDGKNTHVAYKDKDQTHIPKSSTQKVTTNIKRNSFKAPFLAQKNSLKNAENVFDPCKTENELTGCVTWLNVTACKPFSHNYATDEQSYSYEKNIPSSSKVPEHSKDENVHYTKKYSYTTTEIDIWTKDENSDKNTLQVIKKLKVDFDITVAQEKTNSNIKKYENETQGQIINKNVYAAYNNELQLSKDLLEPLNEKCLITMASSKKIYNKEIRLVTRNYNENHIHTEDNLYTKENIHFDNKHNNSKNQVKARFTGIIEDRDFITKGTTETAKNFKTRNSSTKTEINNIKEVYSSSTNMSKNNKCKNYIPDEKKSSIQSILEKYANILKENAESITTIKKDVPSSQSKTQKQMKPKRPFNITSINRIEASLPKSLVSDITKTLNVSSDHNEPERENRSQTIISLERPMTQLVIPAQPIVEKSLQDIPDLVLPQLKSEEVEGNFNVDYSMLDPKTLLQRYIHKEENVEIIPPPLQFCNDGTYSQNVEIIPPPQQFCDNGTYSPIHNDIGNNSNLSTDPGHFEQFHYDDDLVDFPTYLEREKSVFDDRMEMTPKEVETWTLSTENGLKSSESPIHKSMKSSTSITNNYTNRYDNPNINIGSRKVKLDQFKINIKKQYKVKRN